MLQSRVVHSQPPSPKGRKWTPCPRLLPYTLPPPPQPLPLWPPFCIKTNPELLTQKHKTPPQGDTREANLIRSGVSSCPLHAWETVLRMSR